MLYIYGSVKMIFYHSAGDCMLQFLTCCPFMGTDLVFSERAINLLTLTPSAPNLGPDKPGLIPPNMLPEEFNSLLALLSQAIDISLNFSSSSAKEKITPKLKSFKRQQIITLVDNTNL